MAFGASPAPEADVHPADHFDPFPGDPTGANPASLVFAAGGAPSNATIRDLAARFGVSDVDTSTAFVGRGAELTSIDGRPAGSLHADPFGGAGPVGDVHPNEAGYDVIAARFAAATRSAAVVPEPSAVALPSAGLGAVGVPRRRGETAT